jgi:formamidopyrimidine-DNA glycosylase
MPELPEVETISGQLNQTLSGKTIKSVNVFSDKSFQGNAKQLVGRKIMAVDRHAKMVVFHLDIDRFLVLIHLKMTGQLVWRKRARQIAGGHPSNDWDASLPNSHTRVMLSFSDDSVLYFNDLRKFGWVRVISDRDFERLLARLPSDIIDPKLNLDSFKSILGRSRRAIKLVLMDQEKIGGIGNIYANDALNLAKISPHRPANSLSAEEAKRLLAAAKRVVNLGIKYGGATYSDYKDSKGQGGKYQEYFLTYGREGEKCKNCGAKILKESLGGRGTYWCSNCQK